MRDTASILHLDLDVATVTEVGEQLRSRVHEVTGGLTATVGIASSKFLAKVASELDKPDGMTVVPPGTELDLLRPMKVHVIPVPVDRVMA